MEFYYGYCGIPWQCDRGCAVDVSRGDDTCEQVVGKTRVLPRCEDVMRYCNTRRLVGQTHRYIRRVCRSPDDGCSPRDDQDSYDAMTIRKDPHDRVRYSARVDRESSRSNSSAYTYVRYKRTDTYEIYEIYNIQEQCY